MGDRDILQNTSEAVLVEVVKIHTRGHRLKLKSCRATWSGVGNLGLVTILIGKLQSRRSNEIWTAKSSGRNARLYNSTS